MKIALLLCIALAFVGLQGGQSVQAVTAHCKELNQVNCYQSRNEGYFCNSKDQTKTETRWFYYKGVCKPFTYKGCNGNRNRFCTAKSCEQRCGEN